MKNVLIIAGALTALTLAGCQKQSPITTSVATSAPTPTVTTTREEPLYELTPNRFREAWMAFTKDGRYRMAQTNEVGGMPFNGGFFNDVLVIVVDETLTDDSRLKLAYFKPFGTKGDYKLYWVDHNFHLANSRLGNASSTLYVYEGREPPTRSGPLRWDALRRKYTCFAT